MKRIAWLTDLHLNFLLADDVGKFLLSVAALRADAVLVGGDIGEAHNICDYLERMRELVGAPIYFVLGNHDFYRGSIVAVRRRVARLCASQNGLVYLSNADAVSLTDQVALVGHDGWADGRAGDYARSLVSMMDYRLIGELADLNKQSRWEMLKLLGDEAAAHIRRVLPPALTTHRKAILLTHVPPLRQACWHEGTISDDDWAPHFTCQAMGEAILEIMQSRPQCGLTVLCGHTHGQGQCGPLPNVSILTGGADYGSPTVQRVLEVG